MFPNLSGIHRQTCSSRCGQNLTTDSNGTSSNTQQTSCLSSTSTGKAGVKRKQASLYDRVLCSKSDFISAPSLYKPEWDDQLLSKEMDNASPLMQRAICAAKIEVAAYKNCIANRSEIRETFHKQRWSFGNTFIEAPNVSTSMMRSLEEIRKETQEKLSQLDRASQEPVASPAGPPKRPAIEAPNDGRLSAGEPGAISGSTVSLPVKPLASGNPVLALIDGCWLVTEVARLQNSNMIQVFKPFDMPEIYCGGSVVSLANKKRLTGTNFGKWTGGYCQNASASKGYPLRVPTLSSLTVSLKRDRLALAVSVAELKALASVDSGNPGATHEQFSRFFACVGRRVIALQRASDRRASRRTDGQKQPILFVKKGRSAEPPHKSNFNRTLVFFDDSTCAYVYDADLFLMLEQPQILHGNLSETDDISAETSVDLTYFKRFLCTYYSRYPNRRLLTISEDLKVLVERQGQWHLASVVVTDSSLALFQFEDGSQEWVYRGSHRIWPVYSNLRDEIGVGFMEKPGGHLEQAAGINHQISSSTARPDHSGAKRDYLTRRYDASLYEQFSESSEKAAVKQYSRPQMAAKSSSVPAYRALPRPEVNLESLAPNPELKKESGGTARTRMLRIRHRPLRYTKHECNPNCLLTVEKVETASVGVLPSPPTRKLTQQIDHERYREDGPLLAPIHCGWERCISRLATMPPLGGSCQDGSTAGSSQSHALAIFYRAPCGRSLSNWKHLDNYLYKTECRLGLHNFSFEVGVEIFRGFVANFPDLAAKAGQQQAIKDLSFGEERLPIMVVNYLNDQLPDNSFHYTNKYHFHRSIEGVCEKGKELVVCCSCTDGCRDPVRCECRRASWAEYARLFHSDHQPEIYWDRSYSYQRHIISEYEFQNMMVIFECNKKCQCSDKCLNRVVQNGIQHWLQLFRTAEKGWGVRCLHDIPKGSFICTYTGEIKPDAVATSEGTLYGDEYMAELDFLEQCETHKECSEQTEENLSNVRAKLDDKQMYILDAKHIGNIGRYLNHSCNPNCLVQPVFVESQDPRFHWVAFFASRNIVAGTELTWNYGYEVGSVPGRVVRCYCRTASCRGRLL